MPAETTFRLRRVWLQIHLWLGIGLAVLLVPVSLSGAALVWHDHLDALTSPGRYAATAGEPLPPSQLVQRAAAVLEPGFQPVAVRMPESAGWPATVTAREGRRGEGGRPRFLTVYLDPPSGRVLDVSEFRNSLIGFLHRFHENLTIPEWSGRAIVGWSGVAMLILSLTGIYLWWPRNVGFLRGLRWARGPTLPLNLHHLFGFWISLPLAAVSATGIYLGFPQQGRDLLSQVAPMTPPQRGGFAAPLMQRTELTIDHAVETATGARLAAVFVPTQQSGAWRVQLREGQSEHLTTVMVEDRSGNARRVESLSGDRVALWIRWIHEGSHSGVVWQALVFLCGILPTLFTVTGLLIWLRKRKAKRTLEPKIGTVPQVEAAA
ncbi:MAG: PepSY domain-containing protein [Xanthobacteraceae bacterium]|nr:PepSY domain-containing protein [Xanthobacteraceae bacterium]